MSQTAYMWEEVREKEEKERESEITEKGHSCDQADSQPSQHTSMSLVVQHYNRGGDFKEGSKGKQTPPPQNSFADTYGAPSPKKGWKKHKSANLKVLQGVLRAGIIKAVVHTSLEGLWEQSEAS